MSLDQGQQHIRFAPVPSADAYQILRTENLEQPFTPDTAGSLSGFSWTAPLGSDSLGFYQLKVTPMAQGDLLTSIVLSRLAYGPTPDELERVKTIGPDAYIREQLAPETIPEALEIDQVPADPGPQWRYVTVSGNGVSSTFYIYLAAVGTGYIDDVKLVEGVVPEVGTNLIRNGGFESGVLTDEWTVTESHAGSQIATDVKHSGNASLYLVASRAGSGSGNAIYQVLNPVLSNNKNYTLSFWFLPAQENPASLTARLSNSNENTGVFAQVEGNTRTLMARLVANDAGLDVLRNWHVLHGVQSKKQLLEVLLQFLENHFVTEYSKSRDWFNKFYDDPQRSQEAVNLEFREVQRWRKALLDPKCTFHDLLKISAESPAMIVFLDTVTSNGAGTQIANENYARELLELFTFGVDNGYDQTDIVETSKAWAGWRVGMMTPENELKPLATPLFHPSNEPKMATNFTGVWSFWYRPDRHNNNAKTIFAGKTVPDRFGPPYAGRNYELKLPARSGAAGMQDGYDIIRHLADQPFTQEYVSVKLCRLFIHDGFEHGTYDYTDPHLSPEGQLVKQCLAAWENGNPKGQVRAVLSTIFSSELFRSNRGAAHKIKTPLEFTVSAVRALRARKPDGTFTADSDGNVSQALNRMGSMKLFDRAEPDGYPESGPAWISAGTLAERLRWVQSLLTARAQRNAQTSDAGNNISDPVTLLQLKVVASDWKNAEAVAGYFVNLLYPSEGKANLALYRNTAINFLNTADNGTATSPFANLSTTGNPSPYDLRVRGMVAALMTFQRFQEQ